MRALPAVLVLLAVTGCTDAIRVQIYPPGATAVINNVQCTTPCRLRLRAPSTLDYRVQKPGYTPTEGTLKARVAPGRVVGAVFTLGIVAIARSLYYYPADSTITLAPDSDPSVGLGEISVQGTGRVEGQAFTKTVGGEVRHAAGNTIGIRPDTPYVRDALAFRSYEQKGVNVITSNPQLDFLDYVRKTTGDAEGRFTFDQLPAGKYIITATITWHVPAVDRLQEQRAEVVGYAEVEEGQTARVVVTDWRQPEFAPGPNAPVTGLKLSSQEKGLASGFCIPRPACCRSSGS